MGLEDEHRPPVDEQEAAALRQRVAASVREHRARAGRSLSEVAAAAGIGKSTLHAIEAGDANPGIETMWALARALHVPFGALLEPPVPAVRVLRAGEGPRVGSESSVIQARLLATTAHGSRVEVYSLELEPDIEHEAAAHSAGTVEHVLVTAGQLRIGPTGATVELGPGDLASFAGDTPHVYEARTPGTTALLLVEYT